MGRDFNVVLCLYPWEYIRFGTVLGLVGGAPGAFFITAYLLARPDQFLLVSYMPLALLSASVR